MATSPELLAEYAPEPPFDAGTPQRAPAEVTALIEGMFATFLVDAAETGRIAFARAGSL
ncbi:hypothetical protein [Xanthobacter autotrophicus]|uniref:hypothetical protein n=1 Tax=Xanthobacter autotrophicus TaxID=280 RepID=UPI003728823F